MNTQKYKTKKHEINNIIIDSSLLQNFRILNDSKDSSSKHLMPFLLNIFDLKEDNFTNSIEKSIIELDNLAQSIDLIIDSKHSKSKIHNINSFIGLKTSIIHCLRHINNYFKYPTLENEILEAVTTSFIYNEQNRHLNYNLNNTNYTGTSMYYVLPLVNLLKSYSNSKLDINNLFFKFTNYIQLVDDFVDIYEDMSNNTQTPFTEFYIANKYNNVDEIIKNKFIYISNKYINEISTCLIEINNSTYKTVLEFKSFNKEIKMINSNVSLRRYIREVHKIIPKIVCYVN